MPENHIYAMDILEDINRNTENQGDFFKRRFFSQPIKTGLTQKFLMDIVTPESASASANTPQGQANLVSLGAHDTIKAEVITIFEETAFSIIATQLRGAGSSAALTKQEILDYALYKRNLNVTEEDHLVLLITCTSEMTNGRNILVGRITEQVYPEKEKPKNLGTGIDQIRKLVISVPVLFWLILLLLILLILDQILRKKGKKNDEHP